MYKVSFYKEDQFTAWNTFLSKAKNASFLFNRDFMDYHKDRFTDASLVIHIDNNIKAILPANKVGSTIFSHQGLTYGGLIYDEKQKFDTVILWYKLLFQFLESENISKLILKELPSIYALNFNDEVKYISFVLKAKLLKRDALSVIDYARKYKISSNRLEGLKKAKKNNLSIVEEHNFKDFWAIILEPNLKKRYNSKPVHTLNEIELLKQRFPNNIKQFNVYKQETIVAGVTVFETKTTAHCQYISGNEDKNVLGSLDFLMEHLINTVFKEKAYFDFGISNENNGKNLNKGLLFWKEGFGARTVTQDCYEFDTANHKLLDSVFI